MVQSEVGPMTAVILHSHRGNRLGSSSSLFGYTSSSGARSSWDEQWRGYEEREKRANESAARRRSSRERRLSSLRHSARSAHENVDVVDDASTRVPDDMSVMDDSWSVGPSVISLVAQDDAWPGQASEISGDLGMLVESSPDVDEVGVVNELGEPTPCSPTQPVRKSSAARRILSMLRGRGRL